VKHREKTKPQLVRENQKLRNQINRLERLHQNNLQMGQTLFRRDKILEAAGFLADHMLKTGNLNQGLQEGLQRLGDATDVSRVYIFRNTLDNDGQLLMSQRYEWTSPNTKALIDSPALQDVPYASDIRRAKMKDLLAKGKVYSGQAPFFSDEERISLESQSILSIAIFPIFAQNEWWGFIGFDDCETPRVWSFAEIGALKIAAGTIGAAIEREKIQNALIGEQSNLEARIKERTSRLTNVNRQLQREIDDKKQIQDKLQKSKGWLELALSASNTALWDWDVRTGKVVANIWYYIIPGLSPEGNPSSFGEFETWIHPEDRERVVSTIQSSIRSKEGSYELEFRIGSEVRGWHWILDKGKVVERDSAGNPLRVAGTHTDITIRKKTEEALRESEERFQLALDAANDGIWDWNVATGSVYANPAYYTMLGLSPERNPSSIDEFETWIHPEDRKHIIGTIKSSIRSKKGSYELEFRMGSPKGGWHWVLDKGKVVEWDSAGNPLRVAGTHTDITIRKKTEEKLRESEERFQLALDAANDGIWDWDVTSGSVYANPRYYTMLGLDPAMNPHSFKEFEELLHPDDRDGVVRSINRHIEKYRDGYELEFRIRTTEGDWIWVMDRGKVVKRDSAGNPLRVAGTHRDITIRKKTAEKLRESEERFQLALDGANDGIWDWNVETGSVYANPRYYTMLGLSPERNPSSFDEFETWIHPEDKERIVSAIRSLTHDKEGRYELEFRMGSPKGGWHWVLDKGKVVERDSEGNPLRVAGTHTDITRRKETEEILNKRDRDLKINAQKLEDANTALKVLLKNIEDDKKRLEDTILVNVSELIMPYVEQLKQGILNERQLSFLEILESNLNNIISPFLRNITLSHFNLTPREIQVANLVKEGKTSKEIAELFCVSKDAVDFHRDKLRIKLGLKNKKANLRSYLLSLP